VYINRILSNGMNRQLAVRLTGQADKGEYTFSVWMKNSVFHGGEDGQTWRKVLPPNTEFLPGIQTVADDVNHRIVVLATVCGLWLSFRPADPSYGDSQRFTSGVSVSIDPIHSPRWLGTTQALLLPPQDAPEANTDADLPSMAGRLKMAAVSHAVTYRALVGCQDQEFPYAPRSCPKLVRAAQRCNKDSYRRQAFEQCDGLLSSSAFVECWNGGKSKSLEAVTSLYTNCLQAFCRHKASVCRRLTRKLNNRCKPLAPGNLLNFRCQQLTN